MMGRLVRIVAQVERLHCVAQSCNGSSEPVQNVKIGRGGSGKANPHPLSKVESLLRAHEKEPVLGQIRRGRRIAEE